MEKDELMRDLYDIIMQPEVDPREEADRFVDISDRELGELIDMAIEADEGIDISEILRGNDVFSRRLRR